MLAKQGTNPHDIILYLYIYIYLYLSKYIHTVYPYVYIHVYIYIYSVFFSRAPVRFMYTNDDLLLRSLPDKDGTAGLRKGNLCVEFGNSCMQTINMFHDLHIYTV